MQWWRTLFALGTAPTPERPTAAVERWARPLSFTVTIPPEMTESGLASTNSSPVSRDVALSVPAVKRGRDLICSTLGTLRLKQHDATRRVTPSQLLDQPEPDVARVVTMARTVEDLLFEEMAWWRITGFGPDGFPAQVRRLDPDLVTVDPDGRVYVLEETGRRVRVPDAELIRFDSPNPGLLKAGARVIRAAVALEQAAARYARDPLPLGYFTPTADVDPGDDGDIEEILDDFEDSMARRTWAYVGAGLEARPLQWSPEQLQLSSARDYVVLELSRLLGVDSEELGVSTTSRCVDTETEILTTRGWLRYDEVQVGDTCLTLNTETSLAEWQPVEGVFIDEGPHDVLVMENRSHSSVTTLNHRWPVVVERDWRKSRDMSWRLSDTLTSADRILAAAPVADLPTEPKWWDSLVELVAWFYTEGYVGPYGDVKIAQSHTVNPGNCARIEAALTDLFGPECRATRHAAPAWNKHVGEKVTHYYLPKLAAAGLLEVAPDKVPTTEFLASLTRAQLTLFVETSLAADGSTTNMGSRTFTQKDIRKLEAFQTACALLGKSTVIRADSPSSSATPMWGVTVYNTPWRKPYGHAEKVTRERIDGPVWCPTTPNSTWFARRRGTTYFTGNTYANAEQRRLDLIDFTLAAYVVALEDRLSMPDVTPPGYYVRAEYGGFLRSDTASRMATYEVGRRVGVFDDERIAELEDLPTARVRAAAKAAAAAAITNRTQSQDAQAVQQETQVPQ